MDGTSRMIFLPALHPPTSDTVTSSCINLVPLMTISFVLTRPMFLTSLSVAENSLTDILAPKKSILTPRRLNLSLIDLNLLGRITMTLSSYFRPLAENILRYFNFPQQDASITFTPLSIQRSILKCNPSTYDGSLHT